MTQGWFRFLGFCTSWAQCQQALFSAVSLGISDITTGATNLHILAYSITNNRVICQSSGMCSSFCLTDLYFSVNCLVSSIASVPVHGQIANSREKTLSSISKHLISWLKFHTGERFLVCMLVNAFTAKTPSQSGLPVMRITLHMTEQVRPTCIQII